MSIATPKIPKGFEMFQVPTRGGQSASTYSMLSNYFPELLQQAQGAPGAFDAIEKYGQDVFQQQIAPGIAQRYAGSGIGSSSGMQNSIAGAGGNLASQLVSKRSDLMQQSMRNVLSLGDLLLGNPDVETMFGRKQQKPNFLNQLLGIGFPIGGALLGGLGGLGGAKLGGTLGSTIGKSFLD